MVVVSSADVCGGHEIFAATGGGYKCGRGGASVHAPAFAGEDKQSVLAMRFFFAPEL
jgi:hypothetical protein